MDHNTALKGLRLARLEGWAEGHVKGWAEGRAEWEKIGMIHALEHLLKLPQTPTEHLTGLTLEDLTRLAEDLHARMVQQA